MADTYRAPKAVRQEAVGVEDNIARRVRKGRRLSLNEVEQLRQSWPHPHGREWAANICERFADMDNTEKRADMGKTLASADAAIDSAKLSLESVMGESDKVAMIYHLLCAADEALTPLLEAFGMEDEDDEDEAEEGESEETETEVEVETLTMPRSADALVEERKAAIRTAERVTMDTEIRAVDTTDGSLRIAGYAAMFNREATGLSFREQIAPGAFKRSLESDQPVYLLINHDTDQLPLASTGSGTMRLSEDNVGLRMEADLDDSNPNAAALASALKRGDVTKMSFAFSINPGGETRAEDGLRTLTDVTLYEVSAVTWPAYESSSIGMRTAEQEADDAVALERERLRLRHAHLSLRK